MIELNRPFLNQNSSKTQEINNQILQNYEIPKKTKLLKRLDKITQDNIQKIWMFSSEKIIFVYKDIMNDVTCMKISKKDNEVCSNILELPVEINPITTVNLLKIQKNLKKKKVFFLAGGSNLCLVEIEENDENKKLFVKIVEVYKNHEDPISCLTSCSVDNNEAYVVITGDEKGKIRMMKFSLKNQLLNENDMLFGKMKIETSITSLSFSKKIDKLAAGNNISEYRVWSFPDKKEIKSSTLESEETIYLQFGNHPNNKDVLLAAYENGSIIEIDLENQQDIHFLNKDNILKKKSKVTHFDSSISNIFFSFRKNFLILWITEKMNNNQSYQHFTFVSESRRHIEDSLFIENENIVGVCTINNIFVYATSNYVQIYKIKEDSKIDIEPPYQPLIIKQSIVLPNKTFFGANENLIYYGVHSSIKNKTNYYEIKEEEKKENLDKKPLSCLAYCEKKDLLAGGFGNLIQIYDVKNRSESKIMKEFTVSGDKINNILFDEDGKFLILSEKNTIYYYNIENIVLFPYKGKPQNDIKSIVYLNTQKVIIFSGIFEDMKTITLWYHNDLQVSYRYLYAHTSRITSLALMPEKNQLISGGFDGKVIIWNLNNLKDDKIDYFEKEIKIPNHKIYSIAISKDLKKIATACSDIKGNNSIIIWNMDTGQKEKIWSLKEERVKNVVFCDNDKHLVVTQKSSIQFKKIKDYFYKSSFDIFHNILNKKLEIEELIEKYPRIFNENFLNELFLNFENKNHNQTIFHIYAYLKKNNEKNHYDQCLKICEYFKIIPKFSIDANNLSPLDLITKEQLYHSLKLIFKHKFPLNFFPAINVAIVKRVARFDPMLLIELLENRFCEPYGILGEKLPVFKGCIKTTVDRVALSNEFIIKNIMFNKTNENKAFKKNFEVKILDIPEIVYPQNNFIKMEKTMIGLTHPLFASKEFEGILEYKWNTYAKAKFFNKGIVFLIYVIILSIDSLFILPRRLYPEDKKNLKNREETFHIISLILDIILIFFLAYFLCSEFLEMFKRKMQYWKDMWNYFDLLNMGFLTISLIFDINNIFGSFSDFHLLKAFFALTLFMAWLRLITYSRGFKGLGFMVRLLVQVFADMKNFLILMFFITLSITVSGFLLQDYNKFTLFETFNSFYRLILGDFSGFDDLSDNGIEWILWIFFYIGTLSLMITMLNLLIAIISDTYQDVTQNNTLADNLEKAQIVAEVDETLSSKEMEKLKKNSLKKYLCVLYSKKISVKKNEKVEKKELMIKMDRIEGKMEDLRLLFLQR